MPKDVIERDIPGAGNMSFCVFRVFRGSFYKAA
jgi:hypothetical protein